MDALDEFQDKIHALEQYRQFTGTTKAELLDSPDCAEVIGEMEDLVIESPEVVEFYAGIVKKYRPQKPERIENELAVIGERVGYMIEDDLYTPKQQDNIKQQLKTGEAAIDEAKVFFRMFKHVIPREQVPKITAAKPPVKRVQSSPGQKRQARQINVAITEHGGISVNDQYLRALSPAQRLIILSGLATNEGFRNVDIYSSSEFRQVVDDSYNDDKLPEAYAVEMDSLKLLLAEKGFSRLLDPNHKKHQRRHQIVAQSVVDYRVVRRGQQPARPEPSTEDYYEDVDLDAEEPEASAEPRLEFARQTVSQARELILGLIESEGSTMRNRVTEMAQDNLGIDRTTARSIIALVYAEERAKEQPAFNQVKNGGKKFVKPDYVSAPETVEVEQPYGKYFNGSPEEFQRRYGEVKGVTPDFVNYTRGVVRLEGVEQALLNYFAETGERKAVSEKSVITILESKGINATNADLRMACSIINNLAGKLFVNTLKPASRNSAVKGPRIQISGAFMEVNK